MACCEFNNAIFPTRVILSLLNSAGMTLDMQSNGCKLLIHVANESPLWGKKNEEGKKEFRSFHLKVLAFL